MYEDNNRKEAVALSSKIFALDIGTRSVVGIILEEENQQYRVVDILMKEHKERAMIDGQIHNVLYVAELIKELKSELEKKHGPLTKVNVAAAGRALKTEQALVTINIKNRPIFTQEDINRLELQAVQQAQVQLIQRHEKDEKNHFYCVGYSVLYYKLDGQEIGSLLDQQGNEATVEVIATFLPRVVIESLFAALKRADLEMEALTLEPIAAINVLIPPTMRRLNVALVDIGAGTSDIAITNNNTIVAYGMVPTAGDEITESLCDQYLLDFPVAESIKRKLHTEEMITIQDILGFEQEIPSVEIVQSIEPSIKQLATAIGNEILRLNNQIPPKAVMLIGGGSLTPKLPEELCKILQLPANRVAVRDISAIQNLIKDETIEVRPDLVTPIGIAIAAKKSPIQYMSVKVNDQVVRLFETKEMTVSDAFLAAKISAKHLYGKPGQGISITINDRDIFIPGEHGSPATILVNGQEASTKSKIQDGDEITIIPGEDGKDAHVTIRDIIDQASTKKINFNEQTYFVEPIVKLNGERASLDTPIKDRDQIIFEPIETVQDFLEHINRHDVIQFQTFLVKVDGQPVYLQKYSGTFLLNGKPAKLTYPIQDGDVLTIQTPTTMPTVRVVLDQLDIALEDSITVTFQNEPLQLKKTKYEVLMNGVVVQPTTIVYNGASLQLVNKDGSPWIFQDVFKFSNWQMPPDFRGQFIILRNGNPSSFDTEIFGGDILEIQLIEQPAMG